MKYKESKAVEEFEKAQHLMDKTPVPTWNGIPIIVADHLPENSCVLVCGKARYKKLLEQRNG